MTVVKTFLSDHVVRDNKGLPLGRIILINDDVYEEGKPVHVAILTIPLARTKKAQGLTYYLDGNPYKIPANLSPIKITQSGNKHLINNFILEPVK